MGTSIEKEKAPIKKVLFKEKNENFLRKVTGWGWIKGKKYQGLGFW